MGSFISSLTSDTPTEEIPAQPFEEYYNHKQEQVLENQLLNYSNSLLKNQGELNMVEESFIPVVHSSIINIMGKKQCESYQKYKSFTATDLSIMRVIHKLPHFNVDKHAEVKHLIDPLKKAFEIGKIDQVAIAIHSMKNIQIYKGCSFTTMNYQLLDILEYITDLCLNNDARSNAFTHWTNIFDMLFRGTNIKLSNRKSKFLIDNNTSKTSNDTILFQCHAQNTSFGQQNIIELATCGMTLNNLKNSTQEENDDKEAVFQSSSVHVNKSILDDLVKSYSIEDTNIDLFPISIQLVGYSGYLYSVKRYKGVFVASQVCENTLFIPQTMEEFQSFLYNDHVLEILCNLKRHYVNIAKVVRRASSNRGNIWTK